MKSKLSDEEIALGTQDAARGLLNSIQMLKRACDNAGDIPVAQSLEFFLIDSDFDIKVRVSLEKKKTQHEHGMEMFHGV